LAPYFPVIFCQREEVLDSADIRILADCIRARKKPGNDSDALKNFEPISRDECYYPIAAIIPRPRS
jgi:hypothetical protein